MGSLAQYGPNVRKLIFHKVSLDAIPHGSGKNAVASGVNFLMDRERLADSIQRAEKWVLEMLSEIKSAPNNPYGEDDETIAKEALQKIEERRNALKP